MNYFIIENGQQAGPFTIDQLRSKGVTGETNVWREGMAQWGKAKDLPELASLLQVAPPPANPPYGQPYGQQPYTPQPAYGQQSAQVCPENHLTKAIISTVMGFLCCGIIGSIFGIISIVSANNVDKFWRLGNYGEAHNQAKKANTWANVGIIVSIVGFILAIIYGICVGLFASSLALDNSYY